MVIAFAAATLAWMNRRALAIAAGVFVFGAIVACTSTNTECVPGDPSCPGRTSPAGDASASAADASHADVCVFITESGATRGCSPGSQGPGDRDDGGDASIVGPPDVAADATNLPFMAPCDSNPQCASGICYDFVVKGYFCTTMCTADTDCPAPSPGCNGMGFCRAPG
jgi:hypothetical protein